MTDPSGDRLAEMTAEANALACIVAELLDGEPMSVVDDLPRAARRRVLAYRHRRGPLGMVPPRDQHGPLPVVPSRMTVMRDFARTVDVDVAEPEIGEIEGAVYSRAETDT